jgi:hypothetical protein
MDGQSSEKSQGDPKNPKPTLSELEWILAAPDGYFGPVQASLGPKLLELVPVTHTLQQELGRRKGWNSAIRRAAEVAEHYARLMNSEAAQRAADEIRAMHSQDQSTD